MCCWLRCRCSQLTCPVPPPAALAVLQCSPLKASAWVPVIKASNCAATSLRPHLTAQFDAWGPGQDHNTSFGRQYAPSGYPMVCWFVNATLADDRVHSRTRCGLLGACPIAWVCAARSVAIQSKGTNSGGSSSSSNSWPGKLKAVAAGQAG